MSSLTAAGRLLNIVAVAAYVYVGQVLVRMDQAVEYVDKVLERRARASVYPAKHRRGYLTHVA